MGDTAPAADALPTEVAQLVELRDAMTAGMAWLEKNPERSAYAFRRLNDFGAPDKRTLPIDHPDYLSAGAMWRLAMAYGELWDRLS